MRPCHLLAGIALVCAAGWAGVHAQNFCDQPLCTTNEQDTAAAQALLDAHPLHLRVALTISIRPNETSIFSNGAKQCAFFLLKCLTKNQRHHVVLVNLDLGSPDNIVDDWKQENLPIYTWDEANKEFFDVWIESGMQFSDEQKDFLQDVGSKVVTFRPGNDYFMVIEQVLFSPRVGTTATFNTRGYDVCWTIPSYNETAGFQQMAFQAPVEVAPYVWDPVFFDKTNALVTGRKNYTARSKAKVVGVFEPNINIYKTAVFPMAVIEQLYVTEPHLIKEAVITNAEGLVKKSDEFVRFATTLEIVKDKQMKFEQRYKLPWILSDRVDVVLSHHFANELNFLYLDAMHAGFPVVHNSRYIRDCGYYYEGNDLLHAVNALRRAITDHDANLEAYVAQSKKCLDRFSVNNPVNLLGFETLMKKVLAQPPHPRSK